MSTSAKKYVLVGLVSRVIYCNCMKNYTNKVCSECFIKHEHAWILNICCYVYVDWGFLNDKLLTTYFFFFLHINIYFFYWKLPVHLMFELGIFALTDKLLFLEIYILPSISECLLLTPFVKFVVRSKYLVSLKMLRLTLPSVTF